mgnify:CR=1 FL=1|jgi:protein TonB
MLLGAMAALLLAWFMHFLIGSSEMQLNASERAQMLDFVRLKRQETTARKDRRPERPKVSDAPDVPPAMDASAADAGTTLAVSAPTPLASGVDVARSGIGIGSGDGEYLPIVKVAPVYPRRALERAISGTCLVSYTVTTSGTVRDVIVVPGYCEEKLFERPSIEAALRFKYKPRVIDGVATEVHNVQNMFHYEGSAANREDSER